MNVEKIIINDNLYLAGEREKRNALISFQDVIPENVIKNSVIMTGSINNYSEVSAVLVAISRLKKEDLECYLILQNHRSFSKLLGKKIEEADIKDRVWFAKTPEIYEEGCKEYIETAALGQNVCYFGKSQCFVENKCNTVYKKLKELC